MRAVCSVHISHVRQQSAGKLSLVLVMDVVAAVLADQPGAQIPPQAAFLPQQLLQKCKQSFKVVTCHK